MIMKRIYTVLSFLLSFQTLIFAQISGGSISYEALGNNEYKIKLEILKDCNQSSAPFDNPAYVSVYDQLGVLVENLAIPLENPVEDLGGLLEDNCDFHDGFCKERALYETNVTLPFLEGGYTVAYQRCCRSVEIENLLNPVETGLTFFTHINVSEPNSSPVFKNIIPCPVVLNSNFTFDASATDVDGDSLVYELTAVSSGGSLTTVQPIPASPPPYDNALFLVPDFFINNMLGGNNPLTIDPVTGMMIAIPNTLGRFQVAYKVTEYGIADIKGETYKEFIIDVVSVVGNEEVEEADGLSLFPNPVDQDLVWEMELKNTTTISANIYDLQGRSVQTIFQNEVFQAGQFSGNINLSQLEPGVYFLEIEGENLNLVRKLIKQ